MDRMTAGDRVRGLDAELLPNGLVRVESRRSGSTGLWELDGTPRSGDLTRARNGMREAARALVLQLAGRGDSAPVAPATPTPAQLRESEATSYWLRDALESALDRDPCDAAADAEVLARVLAEHRDAVLARSRR